MTLHIRSRRSGAVLGVASLAALAVTGIVTAGSADAAAAHGNPYSPQVGHTYRHGVIPTVGTQAKMNSYAKAHPATITATGPQTLSYGGGVDGIGVQSGHSKVYLVFYGTQWGTQSTDANGNAKFTGDSAGVAGVTQQMFKGIGTNNELWSADLTQWCDGAGVATGATACPASGASYIPYQTGGVLSGVWYDNSAASPTAASGHQLGQEAVNAAAHFGNTTAASNRYAYYVILSPHGTNPDNYQGQYCAWHDYNGDTTLTGGAVASSYGDIAFSNQPYNIDSGAGCGVGFVNSPGTTDGYTMTLGHEWHEMMSDQNPAGGWTNHVSGSSYNGQENSDECAWLSPGTAGGAANVSFGSFGTYAEQASWSNDTNNCAISHAIVSHGTSGVTVANPGSQTGTVGTAKSLTMSASGGTAPYTWSASGLPTGLSINSSTGVISGTPTAAGTFSSTVTATASAGGSGSATFSWTISSTGGGCTSPGQKLGNPGFETGTAAPWSASTGVVDNSTGEAAHSGSWKAWMNGYGTTHTDTLSQSVSIPSGCAATFSFYLHIDTAESGTTAYDKLTVKAGSTTLATYSNANAATGYSLKSFTVPAGTTSVSFTGTEDSSLQTSFVIDDAAFTAS